jgi:dTDP-4-dehydrorhamnose 3,5-epimerase
VRLQQTDLRDVLAITPSRSSDSRGYFSETFREDWFTANVAKVTFVQENQSLSVSAGVVRGLHFQSAPSAQGKLVRCLSGSIFDVAVDIRKGSADYGKWTAVTLTAADGNQLWIPAGFLHGFCTLAPNCLVSYRVTSYYNKDAEKGVRWDDAEIGVVWPDAANPALLSPKDANQPLLSALPDYFYYSGES